MNASTVIECRDVSFAFGDVPVLQGANFRIEERELVAMIGPNGGGKTTLLKLILGLIRPDSGTVSVFGAESASARSRIGYMPQYAHHDPLFPVTVLDVVLMGRLERRWGGPYLRSDREVALAALAEVGLVALAKRLFQNLSGGQRQRVLIARALATEPDILLLDEPTANVDIVVETQFYEILKQLNERMTIVMVSHDLGLVSKIVDKVICVSGCVRVHPTGEIDARIIEEMYGPDFCMVRHDHALGTGEGGHE